MDAQAPVGQPPGEPLVDRSRATRGGGHVVGLVVQAADRAVVDDAPGVARDHAVADAAGLQVGEAVRVEAVEELAGVGSAHYELSQRGDVDQAGRLVYRQRLGARVAVVVGPAPVARPHHVGSQVAVAAVDRGALGRLEGPPGQRPHRHRLPGRARGGGAHVLQALPGLLRHQAYRGQLAHAALAGAHRGGGVALGELDRVVALLHAQVDVLGGHVLAQAGKALALAGAGARGRDRRTGPDRRFVPSSAVDTVRGPLTRGRVAEPQGVRRLGAGHLAGQLGAVQLAVTGHLAGRQQVLGQLRRARTGRARRHSRCGRRPGRAARWQERFRPRPPAGRRPPHARRSRPPRRPAPPAPRPGRGCVRGPPARWRPSVSPRRAGPVPAPPESRRSPAGRPRRPAPRRRPAAPGRPPARGRSRWPPRPASPAARRRATAAAVPRPRASRRAGRCRQTAAAARSRRSRTRGGGPAPDAGCRPAIRGPARRRRRARARWTAVPPRPPGPARPARGRTRGRLRPAAGRPAPVPRRPGPRPRPARRPRSRRPVRRRRRRPPARRRGGAGTRCATPARAGSGAAGRGRRRPAAPSRTAARGDAGG